MIWGNTKKIAVTKLLNVMKCYTFMYVSEGHIDYMTKTFSFNLIIVNFCGCIEPP